MNIPILFEDEHLIVINKPAGLVVNAAQSVQDLTVEDWARERFHFPKEHTDNDFLSRAGIVHRIDKETSGCLVLAKDEDTFVRMQTLFKERSVDKTYIAICHGELPARDGEIRAPVGRLPWNRERFGILPGGKDAVTSYIVQRVVESPAGDERLSIVEVHPHTGRTHQIRVHLKHIGHPIVGDWQYAGRKTSRDDRTWAGRVLLHAWKIRFAANTGEMLAIEAPVPDDMNRIISGKVNA